MGGKRKRENSPTQGRVKKGQAASNGCGVRYQFAAITSGRDHAEQKGGRFVGGVLGGDLGRKGKGSPRVSRVINLQNSLLRVELLATSGREGYRKGKQRRKRKSAVDILVDSWRRKGLARAEKKGGQWTRKDRNSIGVKAVF